MVPGSAGLMATIKAKCTDVLKAPAGKLTYVFVGDDGGDHLYASWTQGATLRAPWLKGQEIDITISEPVSK